MAKHGTLAHFLFSSNEPENGLVPSLTLVRLLAQRCKEHYPSAPDQFVSRHLFLQLCWQSIYAYTYWLTKKQSPVMPTHTLVHLHGAYCRGLSFSHASTANKKMQFAALIRFFTQVGQWINTDLALSQKEQGRLLLDTLNNAIQRANSLAIAHTTHITYCHKQLHSLICQGFDLTILFEPLPLRLTCCRYYLAGYDKCQTCPKKDSRNNEPTS
ncbi:MULTISPECIES: hypothetical protein [unclassified Pseudoalteromonas]|uniref:hypothetical protein n=1 Tax=unclassified Pseudoalteromonas TaxID=194690 RepID=UPI00386B7071